MFFSSCSYHLPFSYLSCTHILAGWTSWPDGSLTVSVCFNSWWLAGWLWNSVPCQYHMWSICLSIPCTCCLSLILSFFCLWHLCFSSVACQDSSLCRDKKELFSLFSCHTSKVVISCTFSPFLLLFFLARWWLRQSIGAGSAQGVNCLSSHIARDGRDPHLFGVGV